MAIESPKKNRKSLAALQEEMGLSEDEAVEMVNAFKTNKLNVDKKEFEESDNDLKPPEQEVKEKVPEEELSIVKQMFTETQTDDFKSADTPPGQSIQLQANEHANLAEKDIGYDTWLIIRGPLVAKIEDNLVVGIGRVASVIKSA